MPPAIQNHEFGPYAQMVKPYEKSVVLGGGRVLFPVQPEHTKSFAQIIKLHVDAAEKAAFQRGLDQAQESMRQSMGL